MDEINIAFDHDRLPPAELERLSRDDEMAWRHVIPAARQVLGLGIRVLLWP